jgi:glycosyltransferase involved in cell wall biosynthesis
MIKNTINPPITIIVFCCNDAARIKGHIENISFADEIIFIDDNSPDNTAAIAEEPGIIILKQTTDNKEKQQSIAIKSAQNNWIILLDANQYISSELKAEILVTLSTSNVAELYFVRETLFFFGKTIKYGALYSKTKILLFDKKRYLYKGEQKIKFMQRQKIFKTRINSYAYKNFDDYNSCLNLVRKEEALVLFQNKIKPNFYHFLMKPFLSFINQYFVKLGFMDGKEGYILAYINSFSILKRYLILWLLYYDMD